MGPTWGPMLAPETLLSGYLMLSSVYISLCCVVVWCVVLRCVVLCCVVLCCVVAWHGIAYHIISHHIFPTNIKRKIQYISMINISNLNMIIKLSTNILTIIEISPDSYFIMSYISNQHQKTIAIHRVHINDSYFRLMTIVRWITNILTIFEISHSLEQRQMTTVTDNYFVCSTVYSGQQQRKRQSSVLLSLCEGNPWPGDSHHKVPAFRKTLLCQYVIMR